VRAVRTPEAVEYQLFRHPLGAVRLANALVNESNGAASGEPAGGVAVPNMERARVIFSLLEIVLMISHAGNRLHRRRQAGEANHRACFRRAASQVLLLADSMVQSDATIGGTDARVARALEIPPNH